MGPLCDGRARDVVSNKEQFDVAGQNAGSERPDKQDYRRQRGGSRRQRQHNRIEIKDFNFSTKIVICKARVLFSIVPLEYWR